MANNIYRIELLAFLEDPKLNGPAMIYADGGIDYVKLHPVKIKAMPKNKATHGNWIVGLDGSYMCSECGRVFRYEIGNYCSNCGVRLEYEE